MKKVILTFSFALLISCILNAQEETKTETDPILISKKGYTVLPEKGDIALGIDASPILNFAGNMFNGNIGNSTAFDFTNSDNAIYGKYFLDDKTAVRASVRIGMGTTTDVRYIMEDNLTPDPLVTVEDKRFINTNNIIIGLGYEKRRGKGRVQGFYGAEFLFGMNSQKNSYEYGNKFSGDFTSPRTTDFGSNIDNNSRVTESVNGASYGVGLGAFIGVEYFLAPKISLGGQFGWGGMYNIVGESEETCEKWENDAIKTTSEKIAPGFDWNIDTNASGSIFMLFHF